MDFAEWWDLADRLYLGNDVSMSVTVCVKWGIRWITLHGLSLVDTWLSLPITFHRHNYRSINAASKILMEEAWFWIQNYSVMSMLDRASESLSKGNWCGEIDAEEQIEQVNACAVTNWTTCWWSLISVWDSAKSCENGILHERLTSPNC